MSLELYALFETNDSPKRLKSSGDDEFYYYFPPPLPEFIVLFMVTKDPTEVNYSFKVSVCIDNDLDDKYIGEMGGDKLSICWNSDWTEEETEHAKTVAKLGRVLKLTVDKEELPVEEVVDEEAVEADQSTDGNGIKGEDEDELLKSSIAMLDDELDQNKSALQSLIKGSMNGNHAPKPAEKKGRGRPRKNPGEETPKKTKKETTEKKTKKATEKSPKKMKTVPDVGMVAGSFAFEDETEKFDNQKVVAGRIGGKRASPFVGASKASKKTHQEPINISEMIPTRNPSRRWGHTFCPLNPGHAIVIGGEGENSVTNADGIWLLDTTTSTWKSELTDDPNIARRVGHSACYDAKENCVYLYGGLKREEWFSDVYKLNIKTMKWSKLESIGKAPTRAYHSCTMDFEELLIFGGVYPSEDPEAGSGNSSDLCIFSTESKSWYIPIVTGDIPSGRSGHSAVMLDRKLYIFGGWDTSQCFNDVFVLDLGIMNFNELSTTGTAPTSRTWHATQLLSDNKRFCVYGGFNGERALDDIYIFSSIDNSWTKLFYPGLVCRAGHDVIKRNNDGSTTGEKLLVFGGGDNDGHFYNDIATLNLS